VRRELHDFIGGQQIAAGDRGAGRRHVAGFEVLGLIPDRFLSHRLAQPLGRLEVVHAEDLLHPGIGDEGRGPCAVEIAKLAHVLQDRPELEAVARHQTHGALHRFQTAKGGELIEQEEGRGLQALHGGLCGYLGAEGLFRVPCDLLEGLRDKEAQPAAVGVQTVGRQDEEDGGDPVAQIREVEIRPRHHFRDSGTVEKVGMALRVRQHRGGFPIRLAREPVRGPRDQPVRRIAVLHQLEEARHPVRGQGEVFPDRSEVAAGRFLVGDAKHDQTAEEGFRLLVPVCVPGLSRRVHHQRVRQRGGILAQIGAVGREPVQRVVGGGGHPGDAEGIEDVDRPEAPPGLSGDPRVLALGVDHQHRAVRRQQVGDHRADALARPCRGQRQQMGRTVIAQETTGLGVAADQEAVRAFQFPQLVLSREPGRAVAVPPEAPEEGFRTGHLQPVPEGEDGPDQHEGREDQPLPGTLAGVLPEDTEDERRGDQRSDTHSEDKPERQPSEQDRREDQAMEKPEQTVEDESHRAHQEGGAVQASRAANRIALASSSTVRLFASACRWSTARNLSDTWIKGSLFSICRRPRFTMVQVRAGLSGIIGGRCSIPIREGLAVLFTGEVADQTVKHGGGVGIAFGQIEQGTAEDYLATGLRLALTSGFPVLQCLKTGLGLGVSFFCALDFRICQWFFPGFKKMEFYLVLARSMDSVYP